MTAPGRLVVLIALGTPMAWTASCSAFQADERAALQPDAQPDAQPDVSADAGSDGAGDVDGGAVIRAFEAKEGWSSPNGATAARVDGGVTIASYSTFDHPIIEPSPPLAIDSDDYTVLARLRVATSAELGIVLRLEPDAGCAVLGSSYGGDQKPFLSRMFAGAWNPETPFARDAAYGFQPGSHMVRVRASGGTVQSRAWPVGAAEPKDWSMEWKQAPSVGRRVGFYTYFVDSNPTKRPVLEQLVVTIP